MFNESSGASDLRKYPISFPGRCLLGIAATELQKHAFVPAWGEIKSNSSFCVGMGADWARKKDSRANCLFIGL